MFGPEYINAEWRFPLLNQDLLWGMRWRVLAQATALWTGMGWFGHVSNLVAWMVTTTVLLLHVNLAGVVNQVGSCWYAEGGRPSSPQHTYPFSLGSVHRHLGSWPVDNLLYFSASHLDIHRVQGLAHKAAWEYSWASLSSLGETESLQSLYK